MIPAGRFEDDTSYVEAAQPRDHFPETMSVIGEGPFHAIREAVNIQPSFRDVDADGNVRHLFHTPMLVIRATTPEYPFGSKEKTGAIQLQRGP